MKTMKHQNLVLDLHVKTHGGEGSGNFGHAGRPGLVGGSRPQSTQNLPFPKRGNVTREDFRLYSEYKKSDQYKGEEFSPLKLIAHNSEAKPNIFYHLSREGLSEAHSQANEIGAALYVGQDPHALSEFYGVRQFDDDFEIFVYEFEANALDIRGLNNKLDIEAKARLEFPGSPTPLSDYARKHGYNAIRYFDPWATGDEWAILDDIQPFAKLEQFKT